MGLARLLHTPQAIDIALTFLEKELSRFHYTDEQKERLWLKFVARASAHERKYKQVFRAMFERQRDEVLGKMPQKAYKATQMDVERWMFDKQKWNVRFSEAGQLLLPMTVEEAGDAALETLLVGVDFDVKNPRVTQFIEKRKIKLRQVNDTTELAIRKQLTQGIDLGESIPELRKRVQSVFTDASRNRATMIARSETIRASNAGAEEAYIQSGVVEGKEWLTAIDERTCPWCLDMNGKTMALGGNYFALGEQMTVDGRSMRFDYDSVKYPPLHPQCTCTLIPILREVTAQKTAEEVRQEIVETERGVREEASSYFKQSEDLMKRALEAHKEGNKVLERELRDQAMAALDKREEILAGLNQRCREKLYFADKGIELDMQFGRGVTTTQKKTCEAGIREFAKFIDGEDLLEYSNKYVKTFPIKEGERAYSRGTAIYIAPDDDITTVVHEMGHWLEHESSSVRMERGHFSRNAPRAKARDGWVPLMQRTR